ncbi:MAG TPA: aminoacetone oxidase family FAD-binding enzyme, partial [Alphaproteobacteria bacterium]|nr:aminoacetone oxidase family FAD-binding enzyme [Alphaproteobacteria bacterium]
RVDARGIAWHEKTLGQLFCDDSAHDIINMLLNDMADAGAALYMETSVQSVIKNGDAFTVVTSRGEVECAALVIATGGLSIPKMGATGFGYDIARQFGHHIIPTRAALVPLLFAPDILAKTKELSGLSVDPSAVSHGKISFREGMLFTHKGISGPSILQISSYWQDGDDIVINLLPDIDIYEELRARRQTQAKQMLHNVLAAFIPKRLADQIVGELGIDAPMADISDKKLRSLADRLQVWSVTPTGSEGYRTAEVTRGGVDTRALSSKTMESQKIPGLYFIGEVVDVTGWLGGYNFQWAWSSGWVAGQFA